MAQDDGITYAPILWCRPCGQPTRHLFEQAEQVRLAVTGQVDHLLLRYRCRCGFSRIWGMVEPGLHGRLAS